MAQGLENKICDYFSSNLSADNKTASTEGLPLKLLSMPSDIELRIVH